MWEAGFSSATMDCRYLLYCFTNTRYRVVLCNDPTLPNHLFTYFSTNNVWISLKLKI